VYNVDRFYSDHDKEVKYAMRRPEEYQRKLNPSELMVHVSLGRQAKAATVTQATI
jgi:hypothetical protein